MFGKYSAGFIDLCLFCWLEIATELGEGGGILEPERKVSKHVWHGFQTKIKRTGSKLPNYFARIQIFSNARMCCKLVAEGKVQQKLKPNVRKLANK